MKNISVKLSSRSVVLGVALVCLAGVFVYGFMQINGLKRRTTSVENRLNHAGFFEEDIDSYSEEGDDKALDGLEVEVLSQADTTILVDNLEYSSENSEPKTKNVKVKAVKIKLINNGSVSFDYSGSISAQLNNTGKMLPSIEPSQSDPNYESAYFSIAPNSSTEFTLYYELAPGQEIVKLYDVYSQHSYDI